MRFIPRPWQRPAISHLTKAPRVALWSPMGSGKTGACIEALALLDDIGEDLWPALVIAPKRVASVTWPDEFALWQPGYGVSAVTGTPAERLAAMKKTADVYTINFENLVWLIGEWAKAKRWPYKTIIVDESSKLAGFRTRQGSKRAKELARVAFRSERFWELTGTPASKGYQKVWGQSWFLDKGVRLGASFTAFTDQFMSCRPIGDYGVEYRMIPGAKEQIEDKLRDVVLSIRMEDYVDIKKPIVVNVPYYLPPAARKAYKEMEDELFTELASGDIEAATAAAKSQKLLQAASGFFYDAEKGVHQVHDELIGALDSVLEEFDGENILVAYQYQATAERILAKYPHARRLDSDKAIRDWNEGKIELAVAHPASIGHGLSLQHGGRVLVYAELNWNLEEHQQIAERLGPLRQMQSGYDRAVYNVFLVADKTIQQRVRTVLETDATMQEALMLAMRDWQK